MQPLINNQMSPIDSNKTNKPYKDFVFIQRPCSWNLMLSASKQPASLETIIQRGDVVSLISPKNVKECFIKRVIGLPGDVVRTIRYKDRFVKVPEGHCWIEGDNFKASYDSNSFGCIPIGLVIGQAKMIIFPLGNLTQIETKLPEHRCLKRIKFGSKMCNLIDLRSGRREMFKHKNNNLLVDLIELDESELEHQLAEDDDDDEDIELWEDDDDDDEEETAIE